MFGLKDVFPIAQALALGTQRPGRAPVQQVENSSNTNSPPSQLWPTNKLLAEHSTLGQFRRLPAIILTLYAASLLILFTGCGSEARSPGPVRTHSEASSWETDAEAESVAGELDRDDSTITVDSLPELASTATEAVTDAAVDANVTQNQVPDYRPSMSAAPSVESMSQGHPSASGTGHGNPSPKAAQPGVTGALEAYEDASQAEALATSSEAIPAAAPPSASPQRIGDLAAADQPSSGVKSTSTGGQSLTHQRVNVFFATDRLPTAELLPSLARTLAPAGVVGLICCALFIGMSAARRFQSLWLVSCGLSVCLGVLVLHTSILRWQQYQRLANSASTQFSTLRDYSRIDYPLHVGRAEVTLPATHRKGVVESPSIFRLEFSEDEDRHVMLQRLTIETDIDKWFAEIESTSSNPDHVGEAFVFIHGFNVRFDDALKRTAQLATDLKIQGPAICYSWPSRGKVAAYTIDEATVSWSAPHFEQLLVDLRKRSNCRSVNVVAHSMGNRALLEAIQRLEMRNEKPSSNTEDKWIDTLVLAAPDVDVSKFQSQYLTPIQRIAHRTTLYFSDDDRALQLSTGIHGADRLGSVGPRLPSLNGIEAVHIGSQSLLELGHSYYGSDPAVIDDIRLLLETHSSAAERRFLFLTQSQAGQAYWEIDRQRYAEATARKLR